MNEETRCVQRGWWTAVLAAVVLISPAGAFGQDDPEDAPIDNGAHCSSTARAAFDACKSEAEADFLIAAAKCMNVQDGAERAECFTEARDTRDDAARLCADERNSRLNVCRAVGESRYSPDFNPERFDTDFRNLTSPNPYFPLAIGNRWEFGGAENIVIEVLDKTKLIEGVTCVVVNDRVLVDGELVEDTDDWFALAHNGDVYYAGEEVKDYESFEGDEPQEAELVAIDGSFKAGRDGAKPGIGFLGSPSEGRVYRQEFSLNNAEDVARILSTSYAWGDDANLDRLVPQDLAEALCDGDCIVVEEFSPLNPGPGGVGRKYYASGIGFFLEIAPASGEVVQLVGCNFDPRCDALPEPE